MSQWTKWRRQSLRGLALMIVVGAMPGCGTVLHVANVPGKDAVSANQGVLMLSVTSNSPRSGQFDSVVLERVDQTAGFTIRYQLNQVSKGLARDTALYVGAVPAGSYKIARFNVGYPGVPGSIFVELNPAAQDRIGRLNVKPGETQDLGRLVVTNLSGGVLVGRSELIKSNVELVKRFATDAAMYAEHVNGSGWDSRRDPADRTEEFALETPAGANALCELSSGEVVAASRVGSILVRNWVGKWRRIGIDGLESLLWLKPVEEPGNRLVAVGEFNTIVKVGEDWIPQRLSAGNLPPGNLIYVDGNSKVGWYVALSTRNKVTIYRADSIDKGDWKPVRAADVSYSMWNGASNFWAWPTAEGFGYALSNGELHWFNFSSGNWTQTSAPERRRISDVQPSPNGALGLLSSPGGGLGGFFAGVHFTLDRGKSWQTIDSPFKVNEKAPVLLASGALLMQGSALSEKDLYYRAQSSDAWTKMSANVYISEQLVELPTTGLFAIDDGSTASGYASIRRSIDDGRTWQIEYSNFVKRNK
ncbi:MAG: hypothetical protein HY836_11395 [Aquabacterium sp.]|uniref:hypothetical protein n=1 Tax=Aquabacterium sp. TaxID=1872578 RepID=UPI0025BC46AC|nr:hypothetical protein [Aquabacterium sp.]MBI5926194.1 hypothetical protein [Aquabacterium sp.]